MIQLYLILTLYKPKKYVKPKIEKARAPHFNGKRPHIVRVFYKGVFA